LAKVSVEAGAALAGFLQTENVGIEKTLEVCTYLGYITRTI